jgi:hypothetical protein
MLDEHRYRIYALDGGPDRFVSAGRRGQLPMGIERSDHPISGQQLPDVPAAVPLADRPHDVHPLERPSRIEVTAGGVGRRRRRDRPHRPPRRATSSGAPPTQRPSCGCRWSVAAGSTTSASTTTSGRSATPSKRRARRPPTGSPGPGETTVRLRVTDDAGWSDVTAVTVDVRPSDVTLTPTDGDGALPSWLRPRRAGWCCRPLPVPRRRGRERGA